MSKHTPGPWRSFERGVTFHYWVVKVANRVIAKITGEDQEANARLIAAAPELLEALEKMVKQFGYEVVHKDGLVHDEHDAIQSATEAIRKAKGEA